MTRAPKAMTFASLCSRAISRGERFVNERSAHAGDLVRGDRDADARAAHDQAERAGLARDLAADRRAERRIVDRVIGQRAEILDRVTELAQRRHELALEPEPRMIRAGVPLHGAQSPLYRLMTSAAFVPPKPKLFDIAWSTRCSRGLFGT